MSRIKEILSRDKNVIAYRPEINNLFDGSITASILFQQILHYGKDGETFYKFNMPCEHPLYRQGDSWVESLGFTRKKLEAALKKVVTKKASGEDFDPEALVWSWSDRSRVTHYRVNVEKVERVLEELYSKSPSELQNFEIPETQNGNLEEPDAEKVPDETPNLCVRNNRELSENYLYIHIVDFWNQKCIVKHDYDTIIGDKKRLHKLKKALERYGEEKVKESISNYEQILHSDEYFFDYTWNMWEFIDRGLHKFVSEVNPFTNYLKKREIRQGENTRNSCRPDNRDPEVAAQYTSAFQQAQEKIDKEMEDRRARWGETFTI